MPYQKITKKKKKKTATNQICFLAGGIGLAIFIEMIMRKAIEIDCCMLLGTCAFPQISDGRPDMTQRALFVASKAACRWNSTLLGFAARGMSTFSSAKSILFQRHAALLVTNNALCLISGLVSGI